MKKRRTLEEVLGSKINAEYLRDIWIRQDRKVMDVPNRIFDI